MEINKMKKIYSLLIATFFLLVACEKDEIRIWDSGNTGLNTKCGMNEM